MGAGRPARKIEDLALPNGYTIMADGTLNCKSRSWLIARLREAEDGMLNAIALSHDVMDLVRGWVPVATHCYRCRYQEVRWMPGGRQVSFCKCEWGLKGPVRGSDFCPYGEERDKHG